MAAMAPKTGPPRKTFVQHVADAPGQRWWVQGVVVAAAAAGSAAGRLCLLDDGSGVIEVLMQDGDGAPYAPVGTFPTLCVCQRTSLSPASHLLVNVHLI